MVIAGRPGRTRTHNKRFWRPPLYHWSYWPVSDPLILAGLFVHRMVTAPTAVLLELHTLRMSALVLIGCVVATLAIAAGEGDESTHE